MDIYDSKYHKIILSYNGDVPMSFIIYEQINRDTMCYYFQKNSVRQRGLTYWLNREAVLLHMAVKYINLEEDMGIPGIAADKSFHNVQSVFPAVRLGNQEIVDIDTDFFCVDGINGMLSVMRAAICRI